MKNITDFIKEWKIRDFTPTTYNGCKAIIIDFQQPTDELIQYLSIKRQVFLQPDKNSWAIMTYARVTLTGLEACEALDAICGRVVFELDRENVFFQNKGKRNREDTIEYFNNVKATLLNSMVELADKNMQDKIEGRKQLGTENENYMEYGIPEIDRAVEIAANNLQDKIEGRKQLGKQNETNP